MRVRNVLLLETSTCNSPQPLQPSTSNSPQPLQPSTSNSPQPLQLATSNSPQPLPTSQLSYYDGWLIFFFRFANDIEYMTGKRPFIFWQICWKYISPLAILIIFVASLVNMASKSPKYTVYVGCIQQLVSRINLISANLKLPCIRAMP